MSGSIPTQLGRLTNLKTLYLGGNELSGSIPTELGSLANLEHLRLDDNRLWGPVPAELGRIAGLRVLWLFGNELTGCLPDALSSIGEVRFDDGMAFCALSTVSVSGARASEADGTATFTVSIAPPADAAARMAPQAVSVDYATAAGTATEGVDYRAATGTLTIPAGARRATVSVPVVDDGISEQLGESFTLTLTNPVGAVLSGARAYASIEDNPSTAAPVTACGGAVVRGAIADVFDVEQPGYGQWHHVFVDVHMSCGGDLTSAVGYPTAVKVINGPASSLAASRYCIIATGATQTTASVSTAAGCRTFEPPGAVKFSRDGRSTHIVEIPDTAIGAAHQLLAWVDLDVDGVFDAGEPYDIFASDFSSRELDDSGLHDYGYAEDFEVQLLAGSTTVGRAGQQSVLRLRLVTRLERTVVGNFGLPVTETFDEPVTDKPVGARVFTGPSSTQTVVCFNTDSAASAPASGSCVTDDNGEFVVRYTVEAVPFFAMQQDELVVFHDRDRDGRHDVAAPNGPAPEASSRIPLPIAKAVNYVALGDSYSAGEQGHPGSQEDYEGSYQSGKSAADGECRRWDQSYPYIFAEEVLGIADPGINDDFATFACTGATALNIYDPADPNPTPSPGTAHFTDRPSPSARRGAPVYEYTPPRQRVLVHDRDPRWEPRQAVSLEGVHEMRAVDLITLTIGGNDAEFADTITSCSFPGCGEVDSAVFDTVRERVTQTLMHLRSVAPAASIFVLGYPAVTPTFEGCAAATAEHIATFERTGASGSVFLDYGLSDDCVEAIRGYVDWVRGCKALDGGEALHATTGFGGFLWDAFAFVFSGELRIGAGEAAHLRNAADELNDAVRRAAAAAGARFVDVLGEAPPELSFWDHSPCDDEPWVHGVDIDDTQDKAVSDASFHPNAAGQRAYADILVRYIGDAIADEDRGLSEAGFPVNPEPGDGAGMARSTDRSVGGSGAARGSGLGARQPADSSSGADGDDDRAAQNTAEPTAGYLFVRRVAAVSGCGSPFASPGEQVKLVAGGFAPGSSVSFGARAMSLGEAEPAAPTLASAAADSDGVVAVSWMVPGAPAASVDGAPRAYLVSASGQGPSGGVHTAHMIEPLLAYPATAVCAADDTATTTLGQAVSVAVLSNDTAPTGGALDVSSVEARGGSGGSLSVDAATGVVTFTPDAGFHGTAVVSYVVYDNWRVGVRADITVTVAAGCTITGTAGVVEIAGTDGDDVICVPDPEDRKAFHVIDAKAGNDTILGGAGVEWIYAGAGADMVYGRGGDDRIVTGAGADTVYGGAGFDRIYSTDLADTVHDDPDGFELVVTPTVTVPSAGPAARGDWHHVDTAQTVTIDVLANDSDPDEDLDPATLRITRAPVAGQARVVTTADTGPAIEYVTGAGGGSDSLAYEVCDRLGACTTAEVTITVGTAGCTIVGTAASETLFGTAGDDVICGAGGDDTIYGLGGNDIIVGGSGNDILHGGEGDDILWGGAGADSLLGGPDDDTLWGGAGDDTLEGNRGDDSLYGGADDDTAQGGLGTDSVFGGGGEDRVYGGEGDDFVHGGAGDDLVRGGEQDDTLYGGPGDDTLIGWTGKDALWGGSGDDHLQGDLGDDVLWGGAGDDTLRGDGHNDQLHGGTGNDTLRGGDGDDHIYGGSGDDTLYGGEGTDYLNGGPDTDACTRGETAAGCETESLRR